MVPTQDRSEQPGPSNRLTIRPAVLSDAKAIASLSEQLGFTASPARTRARLQAVLGHHDHAVFVATGPADGTVGWVHVFGAQRLVTEPFAELGGLVVDEAHRGRGAGRALMAQAEAWAQSHGYHSLRARSRTARSAAHAFYGALDYRRIKTQYAFAKTLGSEC